MWKSGFRHRADASRYPTLVLDFSEVRTFSIKRCMLVVMAMAIIFAMFRVNWAIGICVTGSIPLVFSLYDAMCTHRVRYPKVGCGLLLAYLVSPGPFYGFSMMLHKLGWNTSGLTTAYNFIYKPITMLCKLDATIVFHLNINSYLKEWGAIGRSLAVLLFGQAAE